MDRIHHIWRTTLICVLLGAATLATFSPLLRSDFIKLDDQEYITGNPHILGGLTWENAKWAMQTGYASNWHPVTWLSHMLDVQLFGLKAGWHHQTSLLFHAANSILLFLLLLRMTGAQWRSAMVAALFALHPLHVESVAWIAERKDVLSTFFGLLALGAYARYSEKAKVGGKYSVFSIQYSVFREKWFVMALVCFALGLMSKPMLVTVPFVMLLLDVWPLRRIELNTENWKLNTFLPFLWEKVPFLSLSAASVIITVLVQEQAMASAAGLPLSVRLPNAIVSYWKYLGKTVWPVDLAIFYPYPEARGSGLGPWPAWQIAAAALVLAGISTGALLRLKRQPWFATGWFWYLGTLVPVIGLVQVGLQAMADRYTYLPLIGIFLCLVWGAGDLLSRWRFGKSLLAAAGWTAVAACAVITQRQAGYWHDNQTVFEHALAVTAHNAVAHYNLGVELASQGKFEAAIPQYRAALAAHPEDSSVSFALGVALSAVGKPAEAVEQYQACLRLDPDNPRAHNNLGVTFLTLSRLDDAREQYLQALRLKPDYAEPHYNLGFLLAGSGKLDEAAAHFATALRFKADYADAMTGLGNVLIMQGKLPEARIQFEDLVRRWPNSPQAHLGLGEVLRRLGRREEAYAQFRETIRLNRNDALAHYNLAAISLEQKNFPDAEIHFMETISHNPRDTQAFIGLARSQAAQAKTSAAIESYQRALSLRPDSVEVRRELERLVSIKREPEATSPDQPAP